MCDTQELTLRERVRELALHDPIIRHAVTTADAGLATWGESIMRALIVEYERAQRYERLLVDALRHSSTPAAAVFQSEELQHG